MCLTEDSALDSQVSVDASGEYQPLSGWTQHLPAAFGGDRPWRVMIHEKDEEYSVRAAYKLT